MSLSSFGSFRSFRAPLLAALALLTVLAYLPTLHNGFVNLDDGVYVTGNPRVRAGISPAGIAWALTANVGNNWHPLTVLSHMLDCELFGLQPAGHHLTSLLLHAANTVLLFLALLWMTAAPWRSALVAALFAVHPTHVESVAWIAERKDVLSGLFWILAMIAWTAYARRPSAGRYLVAALLMALGLMSKPMVVTLPLALLLLDVWPLDRLGLGWRRLVIEKLPLLALSAASGMMTVLFQRTSLAPLEILPWSLRIENALVSLASYLGKTLWPLHLAVFYPMPREISFWKAAAALLLLAGITAVAVRTFRRAPWLLVGWLWFLITLAPVLGLIQVGRQAMADRYLYLPSIGLFLMIAWAIPAKLDRRIAAALSVALLAALAVTTRVQIRYWHDGVALFRHSLEVTGDNRVARRGLNRALAAQRAQEAPCCTRD